MPVDTAEIAARLVKVRSDRTPIEPFSAGSADFRLAAEFEVQRLLRPEAVPLATADRLGSVEIACR